MTRTSRWSNSEQETVRRSLFQQPIVDIDDYEMKCDHPEQNDEISLQDRVAVPPPAVQNEVDDVDLEALENFFKNQESQVLKQLQELTQKTCIVPRNQDPSLPLISIQTCRYGDQVLEAGNAHSVELGDRSFLQIRHILKNIQTDKIVLRGPKFRRLEDLPAYIAHQPNEVCWVMEVDRDDPRKEELQSQQDVPLEEVIRTRNVRLTNVTSSKPHEGLFTTTELFCRWKYVQYAETALDRINGQFLGGEAVVRLAQRHCDTNFGVPDTALRSKWRDLSSMQLPDGSERSQCKPIENTPPSASLPVSSGSRHPLIGSEDALFSPGIYASKYVSLSDDEQPSISSPATPSPLAKDRAPLRRSYGASVASPFDIDSGCSSDDSDRTLGRPSSRGIYPNSEQVNPPAPRQQDFATDDPFWEKTRNRSSRRRSALRKYTFGDCFCGAGGASCGARSAGLDSVFAFDIMGEMCSTFEENFPHTKIANANAFLVACHERYNMRIDVLHLSTPCPTFSPIHTVAGKNDEDNSAASFSIAPLLEKFRPRVSTMENTFGLMHERHRPFKEAIIEQYTSKGYSIRFKIEHLADFGCPQTRRRLIVIASCPGESLPTFPTPTHSRFALNGRKKWSCPNDWLANISPTTANHDVGFATRGLHRKQKAYSGLELTGTILCSGSTYVHPSGDRKWTPREMARLQTFPMGYKFPKTLSNAVIIRQIGNAFPPLYTNALFHHIRKHLEAADGISPRAGAGRPHLSTPVVAYHSSARSRQSDTVEFDELEIVRSQKRPRQTKNSTADEVEFLSFHRKRKRVDEEEVSFMGFRSLKKSMPGSRSPRPW